MELKEIDCVNIWKTSEAANLVFQWTFVLNSVKQKFFPVSIIKHSSARRLDLKLVSEITDATVQYVLRHGQTRWLSIEKVLVRIIEEIDNLREYFW